MPTTEITVEKKGRRHYLRNLPFGMKDKAKDKGCKWDPEERCWWTSKADVAADLAGAGSGSPASDSGSREREAPGESAIVAGRATYNGKTYYLAGSVERGHTRYDDRVYSVQTRDGAKCLLYFRDGSSSFWADRSDVQIVKTYDRPQTIRGLRKYAEDAKSRGGARRGAHYCGYSCPVDGHTCTAANPCHDCR